MTAWTFSSLPLAEGAGLRWGRWETPAPNGHVLLLPGRAEFIEKYTDVAALWAARGFQALSLDWRGQGGSGRCVPADSAKGHIGSFETYLADLEVFWKTVMRGMDPVVVMGHSTGAHLALRFLGERPDQTRAVTRLVVTAPLVRLGTKGLPYGFARQFVRLAAACVPTAYAFGQGPAPWSDDLFEGNPLTSDAERFSRWCALCAARPDLAVGGATWGWVRAAMQSEERLRMALPKITVPTLAVLTPNDPLINGASQEVLPRLLPRCTTLDLPESRHEVLEETPAIRRRVWMAVDALMN